MKKILKMKKRKTWKGDQMRITRELCDQRVTSERVKSGFVITE